MNKLQIVDRETLVSLFTCRDNVIVFYGADIEIADRLVSSYQGPDVKFVAMPYEEVRLSYPSNFKFVSFIDDFEKPIFTLADLVINKQLSLNDMRGNLTKFIEFTFNQSQDTDGAFVSCYCGMPLGIYHSTSSYHIETVVCPNCGSTSCIRVDD